MCIVLIYKNKNNMGSKYKKWEDNEDYILKNKYPEIGAVGCSKLLNRTTRACQLRAKKLKIKYSLIKEHYKYENLLKIVKESFSYSDCLKKMNLSTRPGNYNTLKKYINIYKINIDHFYKDKYEGINKYSFSKKIDISLILVEKSRYSTSKLKERLYKEGLKERKCEICGQGEEWMFKKMSLILDHINGINDDNRLENLRIVCPNCNATLETHCRGYKKSNKDNKNYCKCGKEIYKSSKMCLDCNSKKSRKVERPSYIKIISDIEEIGYTATGRKYGVSDNSIRKWIRNYEND
jgi:predicted small secreted protein